MNDVYAYFNRTIPRLGLDIMVDWNPGGTGWNIVPPPVKFNYDTFVLVNIPGVLTIADGQVYELEKIESYYAPHGSRVIMVHDTPGVDRYRPHTNNIIELNKSLYHAVQYTELDPEHWNTMLSQPKIKKTTLLSTEHSTEFATIYGKFDQWDMFTRFINSDFTSEVSVINEKTSLFPQPFSQHVFLSMLAKQIPIVIGYPGIVKDLELRGFDMFTDLVDTSYQAVDPSRLIETALDLNKDLIMGNLDLHDYQQRLEQQQARIINMKNNFIKNFENELFTKLRNCSEIDLDLRII